jgi:hypothetical protein
MGRGFSGRIAMDEEGHIEQLESDETTEAANNCGNNGTPQASSYSEVFSDIRVIILCFTGFFFQ